MSEQQGPSHSPVDPWLAAIVARESPPCPICRRPIVTLARDRCPHCRGHIAAGVASKGAFRLAWGVSLGAAGAMAGFGLFLVVILVANGWGPDGGPVIVYLLAASGPLMALVLAGLVLLRSQFFRLPRAGQRVVAGILAALLMTMIVAFWKWAF